MKAITDLLPIVLAVLTLYELGRVAAATRGILDQLCKLSLVADEIRNSLHVIESDR